MPDDSKPSRTFSESFLLAVTHSVMLSVFFGILTMYSLLHYKRMCVFGGGGGRQCRRWQDSQGLDWKYLLHRGILIHLPGTWRHFPCEPPENQDCCLKPSETLGYKSWKAGPQSLVIFTFLSLSLFLSCLFVCFFLLCSVPRLSCYCLCSGTAHRAPDEQGLFTLHIGWTPGPWLLSLLPQDSTKIKGQIT